MSEKCDITFYQDKSGRFVAHPNPFVLRKEAHEIRIRNSSDTEIQVHLQDAPVEEDELWIASRGIGSAKVRPSVAEGLYELEASAAAPSRRQGSRAEASPKIIVEASPKIIVETARIIVEA